MRVGLCVCMSVRVCVCSVRLHDFVRVFLGMCVGGSVCVCMYGHVLVLDRWASSTHKMHNGPRYVWLVRGYCGSGIAFMPPHVRSAQPNKKEP